MKILVCIKQVVDSEAVLSINDSGRWIKMTGQMVFRMNRYDEYAVEEAVRIKETFRNVKVDVVSAGPGRVESTIRRALGMGADNGVHILIEDEDYRFPHKIAFYISEYARDKNYDIIFTGIMAEDDMQSQTGQLIAGMLGIPFATSCIEERISMEKGHVTVEREIESGMRQRVDIKLPALLSVQSGINRPRYPSLSNVLRAKKQEIAAIKADTFREPAQRERIKKVYYEKKTGRGHFIEGSTDEKAVELLNILHEKSLI